MTKGSRKNNFGIFALNCATDLVRPIERNRRRSLAYVEDFVSEGGPKMCCRGDARCWNYSCAGPKPASLRRFLQWTTSCGLAAALMAGGCASSSKLTRDDPHDVSFTPPGQTMPIDGLWSDPWGTFSVRIERGRAYQHSAFETELELRPVVWWSEITRVGAGRYTATLPKDDPMWGKLGDQLTISVISPSEIVVRAPIGDRTYKAEKIDDRQAYLAELAEARADAKSGAGVQVTIGEPAVAISRAEVAPTLVVAPGAPFELEVDYVVTGTPIETDSAALDFAYSIKTEGRSVFESQPVRLQVEFGMPQSRVVELAASARRGSYLIETRINYEGVVATAGASLLVGSQDALFDALAGVWDSEVPTWPKTRFELIRQDDGLRYHYIKRYDDTLPQWIIDDSSVDIEGGELVITVSMSMPGDVPVLVTARERLPLKGTLDELNGVATVIDGNDLVRIGETFNVHYTKVE